MLIAPLLNRQTVGRITVLDAFLTSCARRSFKGGCKEELPIPCVNYVRGGRKKKDACFLSGGESYETLTAAVSYTYHFLPSS